MKDNNMELILLGLALNVLEEEEHEYIRSRLSEDELNRFVEAANEIEKLDISNKDLVDFFVGKLKKIINEEE